MYVIRLSNDPVWFVDNIEEQFETEQDAIDAIEEYLEECAQAHRDGYMEDDGSDCNFRIVEVR